MEPMIFKSISPKVEEEVKETLFNQADSLLKKVDETQFKDQISKQNVKRLLGQIKYLLNQEGV